MKRNFLALICIVALMVALASCSLLEQIIPNDSCEHTFSEEWTTSPSEHWHAATCEHAELTKDAASHTDSDNDEKCDVCAYELPHTHDFVEGKCECGESDPNYVPPHVHAYDAAVTAPTCTEEGFTTYTCACGDSYVADETDALGHSYDAVVIAPTCTAAGYTTYTCTVCSDSYVADETAALGHNYDSVVTAPTCTAAGYTTYTCACGDSYVADETAALGHSYDAVVTAPTCTAAGYTTYTCACGDSYVADETAALGHNYDAVVTAPTCTAAGYTTYTCACGDSYVADETAALEHDYDAVTVDATCTEAGHTTYTCACGDSYVIGIEPLGHNYVDGVCGTCGEEDPDYVPSVEYPENLTEEYLNGTWVGTESGSAWYPGEYAITIIFEDGYAAISHAYYGMISVYDYYIEGNTLTIMCSAENSSVMLEYSNGSFSVLAGSKNFTFGTELNLTKGEAEEPAECAHEYEPVVGWHPEMEAATCTTPGVAVFECIYCDHYYTEETPIDPEAHAFWGDVVILAEANCATETNGLKHVYCERCDAYDEQVIYYEYAHEMDVQISVEATCTEGGEYYAVCTLCGYEEHQVSEAQGHDNWYLTCGQSGNCMACGEEFTKEHYTAWQPATCTEPAYCWNCYSYVGEPLGHNYVDGVCGACGEEDPNYVPPTEDDEAPANLTEEYLVGTWNGVENGGYWYSGEYTFTITFNADGTASMTHSEYGEVVIYDYYIEGNMLMIMCSAENQSIALEYANGSFTLLDGFKSFTYGDTLNMVKGDIENGGDEDEGEEDKTYPETPTYEYLEGTWYGVETGSADEGYEGEHTFVIVFGADGKGTITHSTLGSINVSYTGFYDGYVMMVTNGTPVIYLVYSEGNFSLRAGNQSMTYGDSLTMTKEAPEGGDEPTPPAHEHNFVDGKCECGESDPDYIPPVEEEQAPEMLTMEYLIGTWTGSETGMWSYAGNHTFTVTINADGLTGTVNHSFLGEFAITNITMISKSVVMMELDSEATFMLSIEYNNGVFTLAEGKNFTYGSEFTMSKGGASEPTPPAHEHSFVDGKCECGESDPDYIPPVEEEQAPEMLTMEYLIGTWTGSETGMWSYAGNHTFTVTINADGLTGTVNHSFLGEFAITNITMISKSVVMMELDSEATFMLSIEYNNGVFTLAEGKNFTYGSEFTMSKGGASEPTPPAHEHNFVDGECECGESDPDYIPPVEETPDEAPANLTAEYLNGTWTGTESGSAWYPGEYAITIIFEDGYAAISHDYYGMITVWDYYIEGNTLTIMCSAENSSVMLEYSNGSFSVLAGSKNFTFGYELSLTKAASEGGEEAPEETPEEAPANLTAEYLNGTWTGTESGSAWYPGEYAITIIFEDGYAAISHDYYGMITVWDYYIEGNTLTIMCSAENSSVMLEYSNGSFSVLAGSKNFTFGYELSLTKA